jgi:hypothetical protein
MKTTYSDDDLLRQQSELLYDLIREILQQENGSREKQRKALDKLITLIPKLPGIRKKIDLRIEYQDALNRTFENVWLNINRFPILFQLDLNNADVSHVETCFVKWFNKILQLGILFYFLKKIRREYARVYKCKSRQ